MTEPAPGTRATLTAVDPRRAARIGAAVGVVLFVVWMLAAVLVYVLLGVTGVWSRVNGLAGDLFGSGGVGAGMYFGVAVAVGVLEVVVAALAVPVGALVYNAVAGYTGGLQVTVEAAVEPVETVEPVEPVVKDPAASGWGQRPEPAEAGGAHRAADGGAAGNQPENLPENLH